MELIDEHIAAFRTSALQQFSNGAPWEMTSSSAAIVERLLVDLGTDYTLSGNVAWHLTSTIEVGAILKGPAIIGPKCFIGAGTLVRGGCWLEGNCILGPGAELKSSFVFGGSKLAHFNFVGDSILGSGVNLEAGSIIANYRNEWTDPTISFVHRGNRISTGAEKFGALVGDRTRIGANAVIAPGAILAPDTIVKRLSLVDQAAPSSGA
jgi:NDP-sugar pyrophosphorylase family protein